MIVLSELQDLGQFKTSCSQQQPRVTIIKLNWVSSQEGREMRIQSQEIAFKG